MGTIVLLITGFFLGGALGWLWAKGQWSAKSQSQRDTALQQVNQLQQEYAIYKATAVASLQAAAEAAGTKNQEINAQKTGLAMLREQIAVSREQLATCRAANGGLEDKLNTQKQEMEALNQKFSTEFENIANRILDTKTEKFTQLNKVNLENILEPLGRNIQEFKEQVSKVYQDESRERFSLGEKVKDLSLLNLQLSEDAKNLTRALKGEAKTQGRWGEMILENILEKSGLRKGEEYFMEYQLYDAAGNPLRNEDRGTKMRPDALVRYPDDRHVIIDAKVSLNAFIRYVESTEPAQQKMELEAHVLAVKNHIQDLSGKAYDDYDKTLDFVMMFIPSEGAYIAVLQGAPDLWNFAYDRRILLINPTNLIVSLKLIVDLWKREYQNLNAQAIADRGSKLYDKFTGFVESLQDMGDHLGRAQVRYQDAFKQLSTGNDNLITQATKLKNLGLKTKKELPSGLIKDAQKDAQTEDREEL